MSDEKFEAKLRKIIDEGKPKNVTHNGIRIYTPLGQNICILFYFQAFCKFIGL